MQICMHAPIYMLTNTYSSLYLPICVCSCCAYVCSCCACVCAGSGRKLPKTNLHFTLLEKQFLKLNQNHPSSITVKSEDNSNNINANNSTDNKCDYDVNNSNAINGGGVVSVQSVSTVGGSFTRYTATSYTATSYCICVSLVSHYF